MSADIHLPKQIHCLSLGAARVQEIKAIVDKLDDCKYGSSKRAYQRLPKHMQRRAVSSNPNRLPRNIRYKHLREISDNKKNLTKRPRGKYRCRPQNLPNEYCSRQREFVWLETHVWHAKRFRIERKWGYALPLSPTNKGYRATVRGMKESCLVQDISFLCCVQLEGNQESILSCLRYILDDEGFEALSKIQVLQGHEWVHVSLYKPNEQPYGCLGDVDCLWLPFESTEVAKLWIWVHPSTYCDVIDILQKALDLSPVHNELSQSMENGNECSEERMEDGKDSLKCSEDIDSGNNVKSHITIKVPVKTDKLQLRNIPFCKTPKFSTPDGQLKMIILKDIMNRFRLTGPKSYASLVMALKPADVNFDLLPSDDINLVKMASDQTTSNKTLSDEIEPLEIPPTSSWYVSYYSTEKMQLNHSLQVDAWKQCGSIGLPRRCVLPLVIRDPRTTLLPRKMTAAPLLISDDVSASDMSCDWPLCSPLYDFVIRDKVTLERCPDAAVNARRSAMLVPGTALVQTSQEALVPVLIIARPPSVPGGRGSGCDLVFPAGYGNNVWISLIYAGCIAIGQEAEFTMLKENPGLLAPPHCLPDTPAGWKAETEQAKKRRIEYFKRPPTNRLNWIKFGVRFPFGGAWGALMKYWAPLFGGEGVSKGEQFFILRNRQELCHLATLMSRFNWKRTTVKKQKLDVDEKKPKLTERSADDKLHLLKPEEAIRQNLSEAIVGVQILLKGKGTVEDCAMICLPKQEDLDSLGIGEAPAEPVHEDFNILERKCLKAEHSAIKLRIRRQKRKAKLEALHSLDLATGQRESQLVAAAMLKMCAENKETLDKYRSYQQRLQELWLLGDEMQLQCCSRKVIGYIHQGGFNMTKGRAAGVGFVAYGPLRDLVGGVALAEGDKGKYSDKIMDCKDKNLDIAKSVMVLVRNPSSLQYRWACLSLVINVE